MKNDQSTQKKIAEGPPVPPSCRTGMHLFQIKLHWSLLWREMPPVEVSHAQSACSQIQEILEFLLKTNSLWEKKWANKQTNKQKYSDLRTKPPAHLVLSSYLVHVYCIPHLKLCGDIAPHIPTSGRQLRRQANKHVFTEQAFNPVPRKGELLFPGRRFSL